MRYTQHELWQFLSPPINDKQFDSGTYSFSNDLSLKKVLLTLDLDTGIVNYANEIGCNVIIIHHSVGQYYYQSYKSISRRIENLKKYNFQIKDAHNLLNKCKQKTQFSMRNTNSISALSLAKKYKITCISFHSICDQLVHQVIDKELSRTKEVNHLKSQLTGLFPSDFLFPKTEAVLVFAHDGAIFEKPYLDISFVSPPSSELLLLLLELDNDLIITTNVSKDVINTYISKNKSVILLNHIAFDLLGLIILKSNLLKKFPNLDVILLEYD
jgi:hypothetical protein